MRLSEILERGIHLDLHEAVAVVRDVIDRITAAGHSGVPSLFEVEVLPQGFVEVKGWSMGQDQIAALGQMLFELMGPNPAPQSLVAAVSQGQPSLQAFSEALGYYERPNRSMTIQELYRRSSGMDFVPEADALIASFRSATPASPTAAPPPAEEQTGADSRQKLFMTAAIVGALTLAVVIVVLMMKMTDGAAADSGSGMSSVTAAVGGAVASISRKVGLTPSPAPPAPTTTVVEEVPAKRPERTDRRGRASDKDALTPPSPKPPIGRGIAPVPQFVPAEVRTVPSPGTSVEAVVPATQPNDPTVIYTAASPGVTPPVVVRPQLPSDLSCS